MLNARKSLLAYIISVLLILSSISFFTTSGFAGTLFTTGLESGQTAPTWTNTIEVSANVSAYPPASVPECGIRTGEQYHAGTAALMYSGTDNSATSSFCYFKVFDVNIAITSDAKLSYWFYPQQENGRRVAVDFVCTDGSTLRDSGATDYNGIGMHPGNPKGTINTWSQIQCNIGQWLNGKTIDRILVGYDQGANTGTFRGYIDDIAITNGGATPTPTPTPTPPPSGGDVVGKVIAGYQGWFTCYGDGSPIDRWKHWSEGTFHSDTGRPSPGYLKFELYPDVSEYTSTYQTGFANLGNGQPAKLFSSYTTQTVNKHFEWMQTYGIDGIALQRFGSELTDSVFKAHRDSVSTKVKTAAENYGRKFYIMYDISNMSSDFDTKLQTDWTNTIVGTLNLTASSAYAKQNNKPVVCLWGLGFTDRPGTATQCLNLINWFKGQGLYVIGGVPTYWRTSDHDSKSGFSNVYKAYNMIEPWSVGRMTSISSADSFKTNFIQPDLTYCNANGLAYAPVMYPGFAWSNWNGGSRNQIPRLHGDFMWRQAYNIKTSGISSAYIAMFDEYDEATAIAKAATSSSMIPTNQYFLTLNADGTTCTSDFYLRLSRDITKMLKGQIGTTSTHPTSH